MTGPVLILLAFFSWLVCAQPAQAYLDPGLGSYLTQVVCGTLLVGAFMAKSAWLRITSFFKRFQPGSAKSENER